MKSVCENCSSHSETCEKNKGCPKWRKQFIENWNENICIKPKVMHREAFLYEHPDLEREGIVFEGSDSM